MKFQFKIQQYQTDAVSSVVQVFSGQPRAALDVYATDYAVSDLNYERLDLGYRNAEAMLSKNDLLSNIRKLQQQHNIPQSESLAPTSGLGCCVLDVEMETGTGKTYVYIKTMFELNKLYGWSKFIVVVPSIAIREGVSKSFAMLEDHFMEYYGKKARFFVYDSSNLQQLQYFASTNDIYVMVINTQAFASSLKKDGRSKESRIIYSTRDSFQSQMPIEVLAGTRPIIILDEPQKMEGAATQEGLRRFNPLFTLNYSATHKTKHNTVYALDAVDAYEQQLVKRIEVKGFELKNLQGTSGYLYLDDIVLSPKDPPAAKIELEIKQKGGFKRVLRKFNFGDNLRFESDSNQYEGYVITDIDPLGNKVVFQNGLVLHKGEVVGDVSEEQLQRVQIRETIKSHLDKEEMLFKRGIKTLSLFFIDEVAKYKSYDDEGNEVKGWFQQVFEEEYAALVQEKLSSLQDSAEYAGYLRSFTPDKVHNGYFSIDKKSGRAVDSKLSRKSDMSDDISAYDLILKNKERLLSFEEPTRFIFSHSALREGWDNPNVFQICTLRHSNSAINKRQEVGRGLRLCVNKFGERMDKELLGSEVQQVNMLTVIANESYSTFVTELQEKTKEDLRERPAKIGLEELSRFVSNRTLRLAGNVREVTYGELAKLYCGLISSGYLTERGEVTALFMQDEADKTLKPLALSDDIKPLESEIYELIKSTYKDNKAFSEMIKNGHDTKIPENKLNENFYKKEFQALWNNINQYKVYTVKYEHAELIKKASEALNKDLYVTALKYTVSSGTQCSAQEFALQKTQDFTVQASAVSAVKYDLLGELAQGAKISRKVAFEILKGMTAEKFGLYAKNPEEFIRKVIKIIREQKAALVVEHISYNLTEERYDSSIFIEEKHSKPITEAYKAKKHIMDYVFTDGIAADSVERRFAESLDLADEVVVYAKLPRSFKIPTPVGDYAPDWAIAFDRDKVKHIFFIAETKGSMETMKLRGVEDIKTKCARRLFNEMSWSKVRYGVASSYKELMDIMGALP